MVSLAVVYIAALALAVLGLLMLQAALRDPVTGANHAPSPGGFLCFVTLFVLGTLGATAFLGFTLAPLAGALALAALTALLHPRCGVLILLGVLLIRPWELTGENALMALVPRGFAVLALASWVLHGLPQARYSIRWSASLLVFAAFVLWVLLSATVRDGAEGLSTAFSVFFPITVLVAMVSTTIRNEFDYALARGTLLVSVWAVIASALWLTIGAGLGDGRLVGAGMWGNANDLAALAIFTLPFAASELYIAHRTGTRARLLGAAFVVMTLLAGIWLSQSRGALIALAAMGFAATLLKLRSPRAKVSMASGVLLVVALMYVTISRTGEDLAGSEASRWNYLVAGVRMALDYPLLGVGMGHFPNLYELYTPAFNEWGSRTAHSSWVLTLAESGIIGFTLFAALYGLALHYAWRARTHSPQLLVALIGYGVTMSLLSHTYLLLPYLLVVLVIRRAELNRSAPRPNPSAPNRAKPIPAYSHRARLVASCVVALTALFATPPATVIVAKQPTHGDLARGSREQSQPPSHPVGTEADAISALSRQPGGAQCR